MNIILGYWLDSSTYPDALGKKEATVGTVVTGFNGLIGILETQLGLTSPYTSENIRIAEWQELIRKKDTGSWPFSKSFETDSWNTAKELIRRRDELVLAGWDPAVHVGGSIWIDTLAQLEQSNHNKTGGFPDRVRALLAQLREQVQLHIDTITIVDEDETLWDPWSIQLINQLKSHGVQVLKNETPYEKGNQHNLDLSLLQSVLAGEKSSGEANGDGSVLLIRSEQEWDAADFLISWLQENDSEDTVLIKGEGSLFLDEFLHRRGVPAVGVDVSSKWRAVLQVLPLTIDTYWEPLRVDRMMELLTIPSSPVPGRIRYKLANALASSPGIGGPQWLQAIEDGLRDYEEAWGAEGIDDQDVKKRRKNLKEKLELWVLHDYYDPNEGIPFEKLVHICHKISQWAASNFHLTNDPMYVQTSQVAHEVVEGVKSLGVSNVTHLQIARILDSVIGEGAKLSNYNQEAAKWQVVHHPGQIWGKPDTILWWGFHKNMSGPSIRTWTTNERSWLRDQGIHLPEEDVRRRREAAAWQRAARFANGRLILFAPAKVKGNEIPIHPLWDEIRFSVAKDSSTEKKITIDAAELRKRKSNPLFGEEFEREVLDLRSIPQPIRTWRIPTNIVKPRKEESATSFEALIGCSLKWTFKYAANIRPGNLLSLPNESIMLGNLGHLVLEQLITEKSNWNEEEVKKRAGELFDQLTPMVAATLLEPKNRIQRNEIRVNLQKSLQKFFKVLNQAGIQIQHTELEMQKTWKDEVEFKGRLDLVGQTQTGKKILFDAKWSKRPGNYKAKLENLSVQLALYHWLLMDQENEELPVAYFMLRTGHFYSLPHDDFPSEYHVEGPSLLESFQVLRKSVEDVSSLLLKGTVIAPGVPAMAKKIDSHDLHEEPFVPTIDPPCGFCEFQNLCGFRMVEQ
ncbi:PD-(D/E)XK nuclease family protein [Bacillus salipaludis]|uniref:PD-(D/E)XK nuclease family protein n=1 Tax=Bacillus salipaludis TaxID=2547811 RepID=UPI003D250EA9